MQISLMVPIWLLILVAALVGAIAWCLINRSYATLSWRGIAASVLPGVVMVGSFYALAIHMHSTLGGWPRTLGEAGFPPTLVTHANWTFWYFEAMLLAVLFAWPAALAVCVLVSRLRRFMAHLSLFAGSTALCLALMQLGPSQFLFWWWD